MNMDTNNLMALYISLVLVSIIIYVVRFFYIKYIKFKEPENIRISLIDWTGEYK